MLVRLLALAVLPFASCALTHPAPTDAQIDSADIGPPPDLATCRIAAQAYFIPHLKDPRSARFTFGALVERDWYRPGMSSQAEIVWSFGYTVSANDAHGAFAGTSRCSLYFANGMAVGYDLGDGVGGQRLKTPLSFADIHVGAPVVFNRHGYTPVP